MSHRRSPILVCAILLTLTLAAPGRAQEGDDVQGARAGSSIEARDLQVLENLLESSVQKAIEHEVQAGVGDAAAGRLWIRFRGNSWARGTYLDGYGVMIAVQLPRIPFLPGFVTESVLRARERLEEELAELQERLHQLTAETTGDERRRIESRIEEIEQQLAGLRHKLVGPSWAAVVGRETARGVARESRGASGESAEVEGAEAEGSEDRPDEDTSRAIVRLYPWGREMASARAAADERQRRIVAAATEAVVETLARYGNVIHGLQPQHRLAVVLIPAPAPEILGVYRGVDVRESDHYVISVPFGEVRDFEVGELSLDELRGRVVIHGRTGRPVAIDDEQR